MLASDKQAVARALPALMRRPDAALSQALRERRIARMFRNSIRVSEYALLAAVIFGVEGQAIANDGSSEKNPAYALFGYVPGIVQISLPKDDSIVISSVQRGDERCIYRIELNR